MSVGADATSVLGNGTAGDNFLFGSDPMEGEGEDDKQEDTTARKKKARRRIRPGITTSEEEEQTTEY